MAAEGGTDFRALRAKFQGDAAFSRQLLQAHEKLVPPSLSAEATRTPGSKTGDAAGPQPSDGAEMIIPKGRNGPFPPQPRGAPQASRLVRGKPLVQARAGRANAGPSGKSEEQRGNILEEGVNHSKSGSQKPQPPYCTEQQDPAASPSPNAFHHALQMWENALSRNEEASATLPTQRGGNIYVTPRPMPRAAGAPAATGAAGMRTAQSEQALDCPAWQRDAPCGSGTAVSPAPALPRVPRRCRSCDQLAAENPAARSSCQPGWDVPAPRELPQRRQEPEPPCLGSGAGEAPGAPRSRPPRRKPLPPAAALGPAPAKPARPPRVDLGAVRGAKPPARARQRPPAEEEEDPAAPGSAGPAEQHHYEDTALYLNEPGISTSPCARQGASQEPEQEPPDHDKEQKGVLFAKSSPGSAVKDETEEKRRAEREKQQAKIIFKIGGNDYVIPSAQARQDGRDGKKVPQGKRGDAPSARTMDRAALQGLERDGAEPCAPKPAGRTELSRDTEQRLQPPEEVYDDVEGLRSSLSRPSEASSSLAPDRGDYEETYEDVETVGGNPAKVEAEKQKRFGNMLKIEKIKLKNTKFKENFRLLSSSVPNLATVAREDTYDDAEAGHAAPREKEDKYRNWKRRFLMPKEDKERRKSSEEVERNIFKVNKFGAEKSKKMAQEEKLFRETFMYDKEIRVLGAAVAQRSVPSRRRLDLPVAAGERLDVIDTAEGGGVICRNAEGSYGYVLVKHLTFRPC